MDELESAESGLLGFLTDALSQDPLPPWDEPNGYYRFIGERYDMTPVEGGWRVLEYSEERGHHIDILRLGSKYRIVETVKSGRLYDRYWDYPRTRLEDVVASAKEWCGDPTTEPQGWADRWGVRTVTNVSTEGGKLLVLSLLKKDGEDNE